MPRSIGTFNFSSNFETLIQGPLDARLVVPTLSDLTTTSIGAIPYAYKGMVVSVTDDGNATNNGIYILSALPATNISNWTKVGTGSGTVTSIGAGTGITIGGTSTTPTVNVDTNTIATIAYVNTSTIGLLDDRGNYAPTGGNAGLYPGSGGSGAGGTVAKGDVWYITATGTMGTESVVAGDTVRALQDFAVGFNRASDTGWAVINSSGFTPTLQQVTTAGATTTNGITVASLNSNGNIQIKDATTNFNGIFSVTANSLTAARTYTLPNASGTVALQSWVTSQGYITSVPTLNLVTQQGNNTSNSSITIDRAGGGSQPTLLITNGLTGTSLNSTTLNHNSLSIQSGTSNIWNLIGNNTLSSATYNIQLPNANGVLALASQLPTPAALTATNDTNVTLTLGGTPGTALLQAASITVGWAGTLADGRIFSASTWHSKQNGSAILTALSLLSYSSPAFVRMTGASSFTLDTNTYATTSSLSSYVLTSTLTSGYVPYTGATSNVNLGVRSITGSEFIVSQTVVGGLPAASLSYINQSGVFKGGLFLRSPNGSLAIIYANDLSPVASRELYLPTVTGTLLTTVATAGGNLSTGIDGKVTIPDASASVRGLINTTSQTIAGAKTFNSLLTANANLIVNGTIDATGIITGAAFYGLSQTGTNTAASTLAIYGNRGTGSGLGGDIGIYTSDVGSTGTTLHAISLKVVVKGTTGNVGIGTVDPGTYKLYVAGTVGVNNDLTILNSAKLVFTQPSIYIKPETVFGSVVDMGFYTNTTERLRIKQNGSVGIGTATPDDSAILQVNSTTQGFLPPRMTQAQREAISGPAEGLMVFQTNNSAALYMYINGKWVIVQTL